MAKLEQLSKERYDLQISKWDLIRMMSMLTSIQVKRIMQLVTGKQEPNTAGIHALLMALVLARRSLSAKEKVK